MKKLARQILLLAAILFVICGIWRLILNNTYTAWIRMPVSIESSGRPEERDVVEPQYEPEDEEGSHSEKPAITDERKPQAARPIQTTIWKQRYIRKRRAGQTTRSMFQAWRKTHMEASE